MDPQIKMSCIISGAFILYADLKDTKGIKGLHVISCNTVVQSPQKRPNLLF